MDKWICGGAGVKMRITKLSVSGKQETIHDMPKLVQNFAVRTVQSIEDLLFINQGNEPEERLEQRLKLKVGAALENFRNVPGADPNGITNLYDNVYGIIHEFVRKRVYLNGKKEEYNIKVSNFGLKISTASLAIMVLGTFALDYFAEGNYALPLHKLLAFGIELFAALALGNTAAILKANGGLVSDPAAYGLPPEERRAYRDFRKASVASIINSYNTAIRT